MKVIVINASPKMDKGNTAVILTPFLDGIKEAGVEIEVFYTNKMKIGPCQGDWACWFETPGRCVKRDDMDMLLPKLAGSEIWVFATPVYVDGMSGPLKNMFDRIIPLVFPFFEIRDGHCRHSLREGTTPGKLVLVSTCGFWELDNFDPLLTHVKAICRNVKKEFAGALLRPHSRAVKTMIEKGEPLEDIFEAARESGRQLIRNGSISSKTLAVISRELLPMDKYLQMINQRFGELLMESEGG
jgi:multimeric flavodoxin WrbA